MELLKHCLEEACRGNIRARNWVSNFYSFWFNPRPSSIVSVTQGVITAFVYYKLAGSMEQCHCGMGRLIKCALPASHCTAARCHLFLGHVSGQIQLNIATYFQDNSINGEWLAIPCSSFYWSYSKFNAPNTVLWLLMHCYYFNTVLGFQQYYQKGQNSFLNDSF